MTTSMPPFWYFIVVLPLAFAKPSRPSRWSLNPSEFIMIAAR